MFGSDVRGRVRQVGHEIADLCAELDPTTVPLHDVPAVFDELAAIKKRVDGAIVRMTARYEEAGQWKRNGSKDLADDVSRKTGSSRSRAKSAADTSRRLKKQPKTDSAIRDGKLSAEQADAVSSGADASPEDEDALLESAGKDPLHELKRKAAEARARADKDRRARRQRQHKMRCLRRWIDDDGMSNHLLRLPPDMGAEVDARLKAEIDRAFFDARDAGRLEPYEAYAADVVFDLLTGRRTSRYHETTAGPGSDSTAESPHGSVADPAERASAGAEATAGARAAAGAWEGAGAGAETEADQRTPPDCDGQPSHPIQSELFNPPPLDGANDGERRRGPPTRISDQSPGAPPGQGQPPDNRDCTEQRLPARRANQAVRPERKVIAHIDIAALNRGHAVPGERCDIAGVGPVDAAVIRSMLADAFVAIVIGDGVDIRHVTHLGRQVTAHQRTALEARGYRCEVEGCGSTHHLEIDHVEGWTLTHETHIDDLAWLCRHHHDRKTHEQLRLAGTPGQRRLVAKESVA